MVERALGLRAESPECGFPTESGGAKRRADQPAGLCHVGESRGQRVAAEFLLFRQPKREFLPSLVWIRRHGLNAKGPPLALFLVEGEDDISTIFQKGFARGNPGASKVGAQDSRQLVGAHLSLRLWTPPALCLESPLVGTRRETMGPQSRGLRLRLPLGARAGGSTKCCTDQVRSRFSSSATRRPLAESTQRGDICKRRDLPWRHIASRVRSSKSVDRGKDHPRFSPARRCRSYPAERCAASATGSRTGRLSSCYSLR